MFLKYNVIIILEPTKTIIQRVQSVLVQVFRKGVIPSCLNKKERCHEKGL